jgi:hypothetical protein
MRFLHDRKQAGHRIGDLAIVNENTDYGTSVGDAIAAEAKKQGFPVSFRVPYSANGADVGYRGVKFDHTGRNAESATYLTQLQGKDYVTVRPDDAAVAKVQWPMVAWR